MPSSTCIIPLDSPLQRMHPAKQTKLLWTVLIVLGAHGVLFGNLLLQGYQREGADPSAMLSETLPGESILRPPGADAAPAPLALSSQSWPAPAEEAGFIVHAAPGDSLSRLARIHGTTVQAIRAANGLKSDRLAIGQKLMIPRGAAPVGPVATDLVLSSR